MSFPKHETASVHHVIIVGGGFGGLYAAQTLAKAPVIVIIQWAWNYFTSGKGARMITAPGEQPNVQLEENSSSPVLSEV